MGGGGGCAAVHSHELTRLHLRRRLQRTEEGEEGAEEGAEEEERQRRGQGDFSLPFPSASPSSPSLSPLPTFAPLSSRLLRLSSKRVDAFTALMRQPQQLRGGADSAAQPSDSRHCGKKRKPNSTRPLPSAPPATSAVLPPSSSPVDVSSWPSPAGSAVQSHLDFGQSIAGLVHCPACLCAYHGGQAEDERLHSQQHRRHTQGTPFHVRPTPHHRTQPQLSSRSRSFPSLSMR